ncbi:alpha/beta hydrolase [Crossiella sp. NPDC003009]
MELTVQADGTRLPATLDLPAGPVRGAVVVLHGAGAGQRSYFLYAHLARLLPRIGIAVLRYDRRPGPDGHDVPLSQQADDAAAAIELLRRHTGEVPIGAWGWSQGTWAAPLTIHRLDGCDHLPTRDEGEDLAGISEQYSDTLCAWLDAQLGG